MPKNTVEVELKIKTTRGKYALHKDICTKTERYNPWDRGVVELKYIPGKGGQVERKWLV